MKPTFTFPANIIGLMSGTSADGVDAALLDTDGEALARPGPSVFQPYSDSLRAEILAAMRAQAGSEALAHALTEIHAEAVEELIARHALARDSIALIGFHGQTVRHAPAQGQTVQLGAPQWLADRLGMPVIFDFRRKDMAQGGQGAPLVPIYHAALAGDLPRPVMFANIGGVANVTWVADDPSPEALLAYDCGPGNALLDDWMLAHTGARYDAGGALAATGKLDADALAVFLADPFFAAPPPKSLDRHHFTDLCRRLVAGLSPADGAATLTAMTAAAIIAACAAAPARAKSLVITGGGRRNPALMLQIATQARQAGLTEMDVCNIDALGYDGDMIEAQAFAYLAARSARGLPLSFPRTTGVRAPASGGVLFVPAASL